METKIRIAAIGYGNRVRKYLQYVEEHPTAAVLAAVVDSNELRLDEARHKFGVEKENCFTSIDDFFSSNLQVDGVIIGTPDDFHYEACISAINKGFRVLLEKPIAQSIQECNKILEASSLKGVPVTVCYVLRYYSYYQKIKSIIDSGELGEMVSINHIVNVGIDRTTHSYVRGIWNNSSTSNPIILSKCCHDIDLIIWLTGSLPKRVNSFGSLKWFKKENAPKGCSHRCKDCAIERNCPYSAIDLYIRRREWISNFIVPEGDTLENVLDNEMENGLYGRCVYFCNNNVRDHQIVSMLMENEVVVNLSMDCFTLKDNRVTNIKFVFGEIEADDEVIRVTNFKTKEVAEYDFSKINKLPLHANADLKIMEEFISSFNKNFDINMPLLESSIESHKACFAAEESARKGKNIKLK